MLGQVGETGGRVFTPAEAQQGKCDCYAAMHNTSQNFDPITLFDSLSWEEEEEEEEGGQEEENGEAAGLPPTSGGRKGSTT